MYPWLQAERKYECGLPAVRMYIDYYNYTLLDYLSALRLKRQPLALEELLLVVQSLAEAMLTIRSRSDLRQRWASNSTGWAWAACT
jgi:hypothetical protein